MAALTVTILIVAALVIIIKLIKSPKIQRNNERRTMIRMTIHPTTERIVHPPPSILKRDIMVPVPKMNHPLSPDSLIYITKCTIY